MSVATPWSDAMLACLRDGAAAGLSAAQIPRSIARTCDVIVSRSAVLGQAHRSKIAMGPGTANAAERGATCPRAGRATRAPRA